MRKTNSSINGNDYYRVQRKMGMRLNSEGLWVPNIRSFYGKTKKEAERKYQEALAAINKPEPDSKCLGEHIDKWLDQEFIPSERYAEGTKRKYIDAYNHLFRGNPLAGKLLKNIRGSDLQSMYYALKEAPECYATRRALHNLLTAFYKYAVREDLTDKDITQGLVVPRDSNVKKPEEIEVYTPSELNRLIRALDGDRLRLLVILGATTGLRFGELLALTYEDVVNREVSVYKQLSEVAVVKDAEGQNRKYQFIIAKPKTLNSIRKVPLTDTAIFAIETHKAWQKDEMQQKGYKTNYLFTTSHGTFYYQRNVARSLKRTCERNGIKYHHFHAFRATFATNLSRQGVPIEVTRELLGHASIEMTAKYYINVGSDRKLKAVSDAAKCLAIF